MYKINKFITLYIFIVLCFFSSKTSSAKDLFHSVKEAGYGSLTGRIQSITMGRMRGGKDSYRSSLGGEAHASSLAITVDYLSPEYQGLTLGLQYVHSFELYSEGNYQSARNQAYNLSISDFSILNNAFVRYDFKHFNLKDTNITIGRQALGFNFMTKYSIRQKDQAFEAIVFETKAIDKLTITLGHLEKFSSWTSRDDLQRGNSGKFNDIEDVESVPYSTNGFQFIETQFVGIPNTVLSVYDYFGHDLYNTFGIKIDHTLNPDSKLKFTPRLHYIKQWDVGKFAKETGTRVNADAFQTGIKTTFGNFSIEPGIFKVTGSETKDNLHTPFQPGYIIEEPLYEIDLGFEGGSLSYFLESSYGWGKNSLYFLCLHTEQNNDLPQDGFSREFNLIYSRDITESAYLKIKLGTVEYHNHKEINDGWLNEYRLFLGYRF